MNTTLFCQNEKEIKVLLPVSVLVRLVINSAKTTIVLVSGTKYITLCSFLPNVVRYGEGICANTRFGVGKVVKIWDDGLITKMFKV